MLSCFLEEYSYLLVLVVPSQQALSKIIFVADYDRTTTHVPYCTEMYRGYRRSTTTTSVGSRSRRIDHGVDAILNRSKVINQPKYNTGAGRLLIADRSTLVPSSYLTVQEKTNYMKGDLIFPWTHSCCLIGAKSKTCCCESWIYRYVVEPCSLIHSNEPTNCWFIRMNQEHAECCVECGHSHGN